MSQSEASQPTRAFASVVVSFTKYKLEPHVQRSLEKAWALSGAQPLNAGHLLKAALLVAESTRSKAFLKLASLLPLTILIDVKPTVVGPADLAALPLTKPLADSFEVAEAFLKDKNAIWGRDYVTLALLAKDDPSLTETLRQATAELNLQAVTDEWFNFVNSGRTRRTSVAWQRWWHAANVALPQGSQVVAGPAYLFTWNPMKFNVLDLEQRIAEIEKTGSSVLSWGTGNRVQVTPRSRVFLLRQEVEPRGLVGVGEIDGDVRDVPHFDPAKRQEAAQSHLVDVRWTALSREPFVPLTQLVKETGNDTVWSSQSSGVELPAEVIRSLERIWPRAWAERQRALHSPPSIEAKEWIARFDADRGARDDSLNMNPYVRSFARVMASRSLTPPLSIGLFGDWGSGKSFFMERLSAEVAKLSSQSGPDQPLYWQKICQISFNAWHYTETNLWASLVSTIFNELRVFLDGSKDDADEFNTLLNKLELAGELRKEAEQRLTDAEQSLQKAREKVTEAEIDLRELPISPELSDEQLRAILGKKVAEVFAGTSSTTISGLLEQAAEWSGRRNFKEAAARLKSGADTVEEAAAMLEEAKAFSSQAGFWWRILSGAKVYKARSFWLVTLALLAIPAVFVWASWYGMPQTWAHVGRLLGTLLAATLTGTAAIIAWVRRCLTESAAVFDRLNSLQSNVARAIEEARSRDQRVFQARRNEALKKAKDAEAHLEQARREEQQAADEERKAREALGESTSQARLGRFIRERASGADYQRHLGLIAMIHRDFKRLSDLMERARRDRGNPAVPRIDRIILYIDDLDRCYPPEKVVKILEAVHLLLFFPLFVVVVGVDSRWVSRSLHKHFEGMLADEAIDTRKGTREIELPPAESQDFLEKIFQVSFWLRRMEPIAVRRMIHSLISSNEIETPAPAASAAQPSATTTAEPSEDEVHTPAAGLEDGSRADAKRTTAEAEATATARDQVVAAIESLTITEAELLFMDKVAPLMPRTPRSVKRFVNIYRLYKAALSPDGLARFLGRPEQPGNFRAVQVLLALVTGTPRLAQQVFRELQEKDAELPRRLSDIVKIGSSEGTWQTTLESLHDFAQGDYNLPLAALREVSPLVARYSVHHMVSPEPGESGLG